MPEYDTANGRLHFHAVHFMRTLPTGSIYPNFCRRVRNRCQLNRLQNTWPYGYSMPIAVRYTHDAFSRSGWLWFFFQAEDGIRDLTVTGVQTCVLPICPAGPGRSALSPYNSPGQRELEEDVGSSPPGQAAFTTSSLAGRPYDLRHAAVSLWLSAGVSPLRVAERAGHSVEVLLRVYAKRLGPVIEVLAQHVVLRALGPVEGEVEEAARLHDPADVRKALVDDLDRRVREHAVRVYHVEVPGREELQLQVLDQGQVRQLVLQPGLGQRALRGQQDLGGDVDPVVVAGVQVLDEQAARPQVSAADLEHPHARLEAVRDEVVELHLADLEPGFVGAAAHRALVAASRIRSHHRAIVAQVIPVPQPQHRVAGEA